MRPLIYNFDRTLTQWIISVFPVSLKPLFLFITALGDPFIIVGISIGVMTIGLWQNIRLFWAGMVIPLTLIIGALMKMGIERARPISDYVAHMRFDTYSFPSGHSSGSMIAYGLLAYMVLRMAPSPLNYIVAIGLLVLPFLIGVSRVYLSAHYPSDVLGGWLLGLIALAIIVFIIRPFA